MGICSLDNAVSDSVEEQGSWPFKIIILMGIMIIVVVCILLQKHFKTCSTISVEECAKVRGILVTGSEFPSSGPPVQQKSTDKGELVF